MKKPNVASVLAGLDAFGRMADPTLYGAVNAFTEAAQREHQVERVGAALLTRAS